MLVLNHPLFKRKLDIINLTSFWHKYIAFKATPINCITFLPTSICIFISHDT